MTTVDDCRPGDPDPTVDVQGWYCGAFSPPLPSAVYRCTREANHVGHHIAGNGKTVLATWWHMDGRSGPRGTSL